MNRIVGVANVAKASAAGHAETQSVTVIDSGDFVRLSMSASNYPADLTPEEARHIAMALSEAAIRVEKASKP